MLRPAANMIPWKEATSPASAKSASSEAMLLSGKIALKPSRIGSPLPEISSAPMTPGLSTSTRKAVTSRVHMPMSDPRGMSCCGVWVSSAASGSSSMPRKNQIANGRARSTPPSPIGRKVLLPASGAMFQRLSHENLPEKIASTKKTPSTASEMIVMTTANRNDAAAPTEFRATKMT